MNDLSGTYECPSGFGPVTLENARETISRWPERIYDAVWSERGRRHATTVTHKDAERYIAAGILVPAQAGKEGESGAQ